MPLSFSEKIPNNNLISQKYFKVQINRLLVICCLFVANLFKAEKLKKEKNSKLLLR